jgi:hypothetical protein
MLFRLWQRARRGSILEYGALLVVDGPKARIVTAVEHDHEAGGGMLDKHQKACPAHPATWWRTRARRRRRITTRSPPPQTLPRTLSSSPK